MSLPPPPSGLPTPGPGDGAGPPRGFGPPVRPADDGSAGRPAVPGGFGSYGPPAPDGRPLPAPPPGPGGRGGRIAALVVGAVVVAAIVLGGLVWLGHGGHDGAGDGGAPARAAAPSTAPDGPLPGRGPAAPTDRAMPYVRLAPGTCFDSPGLDGRVGAVTRTSCRAAHDGEVIADESLSGALADERDLRAAALALCAPDARRRLDSIPADGRVYYNYALYPDVTTYRYAGVRAVSCALTLSDSRGGARLTGPLPR